MAQFDSDNNGVVLSLPSLSTTRTKSTVTGTVTFGISTQANNTPSASTLALVNDVATGTFNAQVGGVWAPAYIDSGTEAIFFNDKANPSLKVCKVESDYYCPATPQSVLFYMADTGVNQPKGSASYMVANTDGKDDYYDDGIVAFTDVGGPITAAATAGGDIGFGLTTHFGHKMYTLFNGKTAAGLGTGPVNGIE